MSTDIDEVYVAHIKSMFDHFDDEIYGQPFTNKGIIHKGSLI